MNLSFKPSYKTLFRDNVIEVRKYPPCKKTIDTGQRYGRRSYFIPLPYQIYIGVLSITGQSTSRNFYISFANENDEFVYPTPWYGTDTIICMDLEWHLDIPEGADLNEAVSRFWSSYFWTPPQLKLSNMLGGDSYEEWSKLTIDEIVQRVHYGCRSTISLIDELKKIGAGTWPSDSRENYE